MKKIQLNFSVGMLRVWIALNFLVFIYIFPTLGTPIEEIQLIPEYILSNAIYIYNYLYNIFTFLPESFSFNLLWSLSVTLCFAFFSFLILVLLFWILRGFKK